jgi:hypothetical protein
LALDSQAFLGEQICFVPYWERENNLESILLISPVQIYQTQYLLFRMQKCRYNSLSGCRNEGLQLLLRMQEYRFQDAGMIVLSGGMG